MAAVRPAALTLLLLVAVTYVATVGWRCSHNDSQVAALEHHLLQLEAQLADRRMHSVEQLLEQVREAAPPAAATLAPSSGRPARKLVAISFNMLEGGRGGRLNLLAAWIATQAPDVVGLNEANGLTAETLRTLARKWGHEHSLLAQTKSGFHVALTSKLPMHDQDVDVTHFRHAAVSARVDGILFVATHLVPDTGDGRLLEIHHLKPLLQKGPTVIMGDLNSLSRRDDDSYSETNLKHIATTKRHEGRDALLKRKFSHQGQLDYRVLDALEAMGLEDLVFNAGLDTQKAEGNDGNLLKAAFSPTVPTKLDQKVDDMNLKHAMRLDYMLGTGEIGSYDCNAVRDVKTDQISDHYPLRCVIEIE